MHRGTIDVEIFGKMAADGVAPTERSTDAEFLRRAMLDLTGQIPSTAALTAFVADQRPDKRALARRVPPPLGCLQRPLDDVARRSP